MKKIIISLAISLSVCVILLLLNNIPFYRMLELKLYDLRINLSSPIPQDERIVYVEMDEEAIRQLGRWPWPRDINACLIDTLKSLGAKQIIFDVTFAQPSQLVVDKYKAENILAEENIITDFINQLSQGIENEEITDRQDIVRQLKQVNEGMGILRQRINERLQYMLTDKDKVMAESLKDSPVFIGYKFDIINDPSDIKKEQVCPDLRKNILEWIKDNPQKNFRELPLNLITNRDFSDEEMFHIFCQLKIFNLLENNLLMPMVDAAGILKVKPEDISLDFYKVQEDIAKKKINAYLDENQPATLAGVTQYYQMHGSFAVDIFKKVWEEVNRERLFMKKFATAINTSQVFRAIKVDPPISQFTEQVQGAGFLNALADDDGVLRTVPLLVKYKEKVYPHISIASIIDLLQPEKIEFIPAKYLILKNCVINNKKKDIRIPIQENAKMLVNWTGTWKNTFRHISCLEIYRLYSLREELNYMPPEQERDQEQQAIFDDKVKRLAQIESQLKKIAAGSICIIGLTAAGTHDYNPIPYEADYPMVGTHGNLINSILQEKFIKKADSLYNRVILLALSIIMGLVLSFLSSIGAIFFILIITAAILASCFIAFNHGTWLDLASPLMLSLFSYLGITGYNFITTEKEKRWIKKAFSRYVSQEVMEEILKDPSKLKLGGERRILTVLFSDIRGFTTYSEKRKPEEVVAILNEYLDAMTKVVFEYKGTLDKYVGDEIMAIFGAPRHEPPETSAKNAVITACKMMEKLKELRDKWMREGKEPLDIGIGINTGEMVVGNMGSTLVMDYTVIGDAVNLGARIEALTRQYNNHIIISQTCYNYVKDITEIKPLEAIKVKGKEIPVMIYEVLGLKEPGNNI